MVSPVIIGGHLFVALGSFAALVVAASAAPVFEGKYASPKGGYRQSAEIARAGAGYSVSLVVGTEGCSGLFEGSGTIQGGRLIARTSDPDAADDKCRIAITRTAKGIVVNEDACEYWHGPSCGFDGALRKR
jgi:hypothetical protein